MGLQSCRECKAEVSSEARVCPKCGISDPVKKKQSTSKLLIGLLGIVVLGTVAMSGTGSKTASTPNSAAASAAPVNPKEQAEKDKKNAMYTMAAQGAISLRRAMKDPTAFEITSVVLRDGGAVCYDYRAKNSFGAILPYSAVLTSKGKILAHERDGNKFVAYWNKECTAPGTDITEHVKTMLRLTE